MKACSQCPWRTANHGKRHFAGFYTKQNLTRLWNQIRNGGGAQSCHMTDPSHPDHIAAGCKESTTAQECPGSVLLVLREVAQMANAEGVVTEEGLRRYERERRLGLTTSGLRYWLISRIHLGGVPLMGGPKLPDVDEDHGVSLPEFLREASP